MAATRSASSPKSTLDSRVASLETAVEALEHRIETSFDGLTSRVEASLAANERLAAQVSAGRQTNWGVVLSAVAALGAFILLYVEPVSERLAEHIALEGHPTAMATQARIEERIGTLRADIDHGREQDAYTLSKFEALSRELSSRSDWMLSTARLDSRQAEQIEELFREHERYRDGLEKVQSNRWTSVEGLANRDRIAAVESGLATVEALLKAVQDEQIRRGPIVSRAANQ